jgi:site-specific DNA recombinase
MGGSPVNSNKGILYRRVSTKDQKDNGTSLDHQLERSLAYARQHAIEIVGDFAEDFSGATLRRPELIKARETLQTGKADHIIVFNGDRLDRSEWGVNLLILLTEFKELGVALHYSESQRMVDLHNPTEVLLESISGWKSGDERLTIVKRLTDGRQERVRRGGIMVRGKPPYGYNVSKNEDTKCFELVINECEARIVNLIFYWYVFGIGEQQPLSINDIARKLNEMGIQPPRDKRPNAKIANIKQWRSIAVSRILSRETYIGVWHWKRGTGKHLTVSVPPIIDKTIFDKAQERKQQNKAGMNNNHKYQALLRQRAVCGECRYRMRVKVNQSRGKIFLYYLCGCNQDKGMVRHKRTCTNSSYFRVEKVDNQLWQEVKKLLGDKNRLQRYFLDRNENNQQETSSLQYELNTITNLLRTKKGELENAIDAYITGQGLTKTILERKANELEVIIEDLEKKKDKLVDQIEQQNLSLRQIERLQTIALKVTKGIIQADNDFEAQKKIFQYLNVQATLSLLDGKKVVKATCELGDIGNPFDIDSDDGADPSSGGDSSSGGTRYNAHNRRSARRAAELTHSQEGPSRHTVL